nr:multi-functional cellulase [Ampullaria crossean]AHB33335.1 multi-functional cellulase [Ampullaria crossean]
MPSGAAGAGVTSEIDRLRRSDITVHVNVGGNINHGQVSIRVLQKRKAFPFGTCVAAWAYNDGSKGAYRDFIHQHYNWAVPENSLKWASIEPNRGQKNYQPGLNMLHGLRNHGIKVRGHNLVWSVDNTVQNWVKALHGDELRKVVHDHIVETINTFKGLVEHWDVNNENLHGQWYQHQLNDNGYNLELFRIAHAADPNVKLFLNDYNVVSNSYSTNDYLRQGQQFKAANVGLYGLGAQCHFGDESDPEPGTKQRLDTLAQVGVPIWATELDVVASDENRRADFYEHALTVLYGHHAVEGILMWGFWDKAHWRGARAALVVGDNLQLTAAGRRVLELFEHRWMTDETHNLAAGTQFTVRGFHGDYEVQVIVQGQEHTNLRQTFSLGNGPHTVNINVS